MLGFSPLASAPLGDDGVVSAEIVYLLTGVGITTDSPTVGDSDLTQEHDISLTAITTGQPTVGASI